MKYKRNTRTLLYRFLVSHIFIAIALLSIPQSSENYWLAIFTIWLITVVYFNLSFYFYKTPFEILFNENKVCISYFHFFQTKKDCFETKNLEVSLKDEFGARGIKALELRIYNREKMLFKSIGQTMDGWSIDKLFELKTEFISRGAKEIK